MLQSAYQRRKSVPALNYAGNMSRFALQAALFCSISPHNAAGFANPKGSVAY
ncbi:hypothetical protein J5069_08270 [Candidatus Symbiopectobacterium sp. NZEC127]|uniref:hypothetical protein n=1 Tax=Candidatus Symbiopectobacterium sp. NZEC127 TaxID=2820472 RepID=UPI002226FC98|nr:hypothetical protein [Candidatus Symbiopectobacterium sp. NZEC127]MCW2485887.1 hypothetical protein [Candidatus Symbiopectobacterium sp. NZEC127]